MENEKPKSLVGLLKQLKAENISKAEYALRIEDFLIRKAWRDEIPFSGQFELTPACNLDCKMCYVHLNKQQFDESCVLTVEQWENLIDQAFDCGMRKATLTGGECLVYPGFDDLYLYLLSKGIRVSVLTNGILLDRNRIEFFKKHPPASIRISLYGSCNETYMQVTGYERYDTVWSNILLSKDFGLPVAVSITPNRYMENDAEKLIEKVDSLRIPYAINSYLFEPREETGRKGNSIDASIDTYIRMHKKREELNGVTCIPVEKSSLPAEKRFGSPRVGIECGAGMNSFQISWNGDMYPCTNLRLFHEQPLSDGFKIAWDKLRDAVKRMALPEECDGCPYELLCGPCVVPHIQNGKTNKCNRTNCKRIREYISQGIYKFDRDC